MFSFFLPPRRPYLSQPILHMSLPSLIRIAFSFFCLAVLFPLRADDDRAWIQVGKANECKNNREGLEQAFTLLFDAYVTANSDKMHKYIQSRLDDIETRYMELLRTTYPLFFETPGTNDAAIQFYDRFAQFKNPIGMRLYGESLLDQGDIRGWNYINNAATKEEPRALFLLANRYKLGLDGVQQTPSLAFDYLQRSARAGYGPAFEMLAQVHWDGDCNFGNGLWNQQLAIRYLDEAIKRYNWNMNDDALDASLKEWGECMKSVRNHMVNLSSGQVQLPAGFYASYEALVLSIYYDNHVNGLRARSYRLCRIMDEFRGTYMTGPLPRLALEYVPFSIGPCDRKKWSGQCNVSYPSPDTFSFNIRIDTAKLPSGPNSNTSLTNWYNQKFARDMELNATLAHELAHGYFHSRYRALPDEDIRVVEGHATNAAYAVIRTLYYNGDRAILTPALFAEKFTSDEYRRYFFWFMNSCLDSSDLVDWNKLDRWERKKQGDDSSPCQRRQVPDNGNVFWKPSHFRRAFFGYM